MFSKSGHGNIGLKSEKVVEIRGWKELWLKNKAEQDYMCEVVEGYCVNAGIICCYAEIDDNGDVYCVLEEDADNE